MKGIIVKEILCFVLMLQCIVFSPFTKTMLYAEENEPDETETVVSETSENENELSSEENEEISEVEISPEDDTEQEKNENTEEEIQQEELEETDQENSLQNDDSTDIVELIESQDSNSETFIEGNAYVTVTENPEAGEVRVYKFMPEASAEMDPGVTVLVGKSRVTVEINGIGSSGTAHLYSYDPNDYHPNDPYKGKSLASGYSLIEIAEYECGSNSKIEFNRYVSSDGYDNLYRKFYVVQGGTILAGPFYASEISSYRDISPFNSNTMKGIICEDEKTINTAIETGCGRTVINMDLGDFILANEDKNGNPIDNSKKSGVISYECNGETFYFNASALSLQDSLVIPYTRAGINVTFVIIAWKQTTYTSTSNYPNSLRYDTNGTDSVTLGFNTSNELGAKYWMAAMEFLADHYSQPKGNGLVDRFVIANEIDYCYDWYLLQSGAADSNGRFNMPTLDVFMEEYSRLLRMSNAAVKKYNSNAQVFVSLTHNWALNCRESYGESITSRRFKSFAPKDILDWITAHDKPRGDYDWGICVHPYPIGTTSSNPCLTDPNPSLIGLPKAKPITGDYNTSPWITAANLELYQQYFDQPKNKYKNSETRKVILTETSLCNKKKEDVTESEYQISLNEQAASLAMYYYRASCLDCIDEMDYFEENDQEPYRLGLIDLDGNKKPSYTVWKYIDTNLSFKYSKKYLQYIAKGKFSGVTNYKDMMDVTGSGYNWDAYWDEAKIMTRQISDGTAESFLETDKTSYASGDAILVTASGNPGDMVGLYKKDDDPEKVDPIYSYTIGLPTGGITCENGLQYDILAYGEIAGSRKSLANLNAGNYKIVLSSILGESLEKEIKITSSYTFGRTDYKLFTNKTTYRRGEDIIVSAYGPNNQSWAGLYKENDTPGTGPSSIYWYYVNDDSHLSGKPTIIQTQEHNSTAIPAGNYKIILFQDGNYTPVQTINIKVEESPVNGLENIKFVLDDETDGFANGVVTVTRGIDNIGATDCVLFWADEHGNKLEDYDSLQMFKLTANVTSYKMVTHTIIPEGAKKLIAYGSNGTVLSDTFVSTELPANCTYHLDEPLAEFQIMSDIHVTTPAYENGNSEVKYSNKHFRMMLEDVKHNSPKSLGIFINGDLANTGQNAEFQQINTMYTESVNKGDGTLPALHMAIGNHDWMQQNPNNQFFKWVKYFNNNAELPEHLKNREKSNTSVYYEEMVGGYHFIYLGGEQSGLYAVLSEEQLNWFSETMERINAEDPEQPVFVFLHQSFYNTVSGSLPGEGWNGISDEAKLESIMMKYDQIVFFNGHSHWHMNSESNMFAGNEVNPVAFNTAAVSYLWNGYNSVTGEELEGSQGYYVRIYDDKLVLLGRDFDNGKWIPSAMYVVQKNKLDVEEKNINLYLNSESVNIYGDSEASNISYASDNKKIVSIKEDGTLVPMGLGTATIYATVPSTDTKVISKTKFTVNVLNSNVYRLFGETRFSTSTMLADAYKAELGIDRFDNVIIANGMNFADALAGSYLADVKKAPILIVDDKEINENNVRNYINANLKAGGTVYILGGPKAVSERMEKGYTSAKVKRLSGADRYATNLAILAETNIWDQDILIATGTNFADSLSASSVKRPILLVGTKLTEGQKTFIQGHRFSKYYILGGPKAVTESVEKEINAYVKTKRIAGNTRYDTSTLIAKQFFSNPETIILVYGEKFPDGLCAGPLSAQMNAPIVLAKTNAIDSASALVKAKSIERGLVIGGSGLIANTAVLKILGVSSNITIPNWESGKIFAPQ